MCYSSFFYIYNCSAYITTYVVCMLDDKTNTIYIYWRRMPVCFICYAHKFTLTSFFCFVHGHTHTIDTRWKMNKLYCVYFGFHLFFPFLFSFLCTFCCFNLLLFLFLFLFAFLRMRLYASHSSATIDIYLQIKVYRRLFFATLAIIQLPWKTYIHFCCCAKFNSQFNAMCNLLNASLWLRKCNITPNHKFWWHFIHQTCKRTEKLFRSKQFQLQMKRNLPRKTLILIDIECIKMVLFWKLMFFEDIWILWLFKAFIQLLSPWEEWRERETEWEIRKTNSTLNT